MFHDNVKTRWLGPDGIYRRRGRARGTAVQSATASAGRVEATLIVGAWAQWSDVSARKQRTATEADTRVIH